LCGGARIGFSVPLLLKPPPVITAHDPTARGELGEPAASSTRGTRPIPNPKRWANIAVIGSSNLDMRSLTLNLEVTMVAYDPGVVADLRQVEAQYLRHCKQLHLAEWLARPLNDKLFGNVARMTAALQ
jgi:hypothetical protein